MVRFFAILSLLLWGATVSVILLSVVRWLRPESNAGYLFQDLGRNATWLAWVVALVTTLGSLYLSEIAHFTPCPLCWYQRILMYPLTLALLVGALRRDRMVWTYVLPPALLGMAFAVYHTQLQAFPHQTSSFCKAAEPCMVRYVWEFGFVSIPFMSLSAFTFIVVMMLVLRSTNQVELEDVSEEAADDDEALSLSARGSR